MPAAQTVTPKDELISRISRLSPNELSRVSDFLDSIDGDEPNEETAAVLRDSEAGRNLSKVYDNVEEMLADLMASDNA
jgi:hypothetical protein